MLLASVATLVRWFLRATPESRSLEPYITKDNAIVVGISVAAILVLLLATHVVGLYASLLLFLLFYLKFIGRHSWTVSGVLTLAIPIFIFCLFEWALEDPAAERDYGALVLPHLRLDVLLKVSPDMPPISCCGRRCTRASGAYSLEPLRHSVGYLLRCAVPAPLAGGASHPWLARSPGRSATGASSGSGSPFSVSRSVHPAIAAPRRPRDKNP